MPEPLLKYVYSDLIRSDLKRLNRWLSLKDDIENQCKIAVGKLSDPVFKFNTPLGDFITEVCVEDTNIFFYKDRIKITNPLTPPKKGGRVIYAVVKKLGKVFPILVYSATEEGTFYHINGKRISLKKSGLIQIIDEKLKLSSTFLKETGES